MRPYFAWAVAVAAAGCIASPASAALLARPGGFYYDTVLDLTWLGDANYAKTSGYSDTGKVTQGAADFLAGGYVFFNAATGGYHDDWRLPTLGPDVHDFDPQLPGTGGQLPNGQGSTGTGWGTPADSRIYSELGWMYYVNLGGRARCEAIGAEPCEYNPNSGLPSIVGGPDKGPFANLELDFYWTNVKSVSSNVYWALTFEDGTQTPRAFHGTQAPLAYVWLVHDGDIAAVPTAGVPEPATWAILLAGFAGVGAALRGRRRASAAA